MKSNFHWGGISWLHNLWPGRLCLLNALVIVSVLFGNPSPTSFCHQIGSVCVSLSSAVSILLLLQLCMQTIFLMWLSSGPHCNYLLTSCLFLLLLDYWNGSEASSPLPSSTAFILGDFNAHKANPMQHYIFSFLVFSALIPLPPFI